MKAIHVVVVLAVSGAGAAGAEQITFVSLLEEMVDRDRIARVPDPWYVCTQASSWDRGSVSPDEPETWFANYDRGHYLRTEEREGRTEWVMMDAAGPGAIVRFWSANPPEGATVYFYLDGSEEPTLTADFQAYLSGRWKVGDVVVGEPLSAIRSRGWNSYLPIPYADGCKVTCDAGDFYYQINYREYGRGTEVESFSLEGLRAGEQRLAETQLALGEPERVVATEGLVPTMQQFELGPGEEGALELPGGAHVVRSCAFNVQAGTPEQTEAASRATTVEIEFDGQRCVWAPVGALVGTGVGFSPLKDWWRMCEEGWGVLMWPMPYAREGKVTVRNHGDAPVTVRAACMAAPWDWDNRSMHFHATWHHEPSIMTKAGAGTKDFNFVEIEGRGVFVGDTLAVFNPSTIWWGEGDEKFYVDGEDFPSHFGTGTEDYYGYAWGNPELFSAPFHAQPRCDGPGVRGHITNTRVRSLDAIPFTESLKFDMEVWHWRAVEMSYAGTTYFYARPGATTNRAPEPEEAARPLRTPPPPYRVEGAIEAESLRVSAKSDDLTHEVQQTEEPDLWSDDKQLFLKGAGVGSFAEVRVPAPDDAARRVVVHLTKSWDYGIVRVTVNGDEGAELDLHSPDIRRTGPVDLGVHEPVDGAFVLRFEIVGANAEAREPKAYLGVDCVVLGEA